MPDYLKNLPYLGAGLGYRPEIRQEIWQHSAQIDFLEIISDNFMFNQSRQKLLARLGERFPVIPHGVNLSIGRAGTLDWDYLSELKKVGEITGAPYYSDHLALTSVPGLDLGHLSPVWYTEESLKVVIENVRTAQEYLEKPLILENIAYNLAIPGATLSEPDFFRYLVAETGCGILLDLTNLYINSVNHKFETQAYLDRFPYENVVQVHLAGGFWQDGYLVDGHSEPVHHESWRLLEDLVQRIPLKGAIIERDHNFLDFEGLAGEVAQARKMICSVLSPVSTIVNQNRDIC